jgi:hypothetical protein
MALCLSALTLPAVVPPLILTLGSVEVQRVSAWLIACFGANQHAGHFLGVDRQDQAAIGSCLQNASHKGRLRGRHQDEEWSNREPCLFPQALAQAHGLRHVIAGAYNQKVRRPGAPTLT